MADVLQPILINPALRILGWLPGLLLRTILNPKRMATLVRFDVQSRGDQLVFYGGDVPQIRVFLQAENRAPFQVELDRLRIEVYGFGLLGDIWHLTPLELSPGKRCLLVINGLFGVRYPPSVLKNVQEGKAAIRVNAVVISKVGRFVVDTGNLEGITASCFNFPDQGSLTAG